jgi:hypothetical protein
MTISIFSALLQFSWRIGYKSSTVQGFRFLFLCLSHSIQSLSFGQIPFFLRDVFPCPWITRTSRVMTFQPCCEAQGLIPTAPWSASMHSGYTDRLRLGSLSSGRESLMSRYPIIQSVIPRFIRGIQLTIEPLNPDHRPTALEMIRTN